MRLRAEAALLVLFHVHPTAEDTTPRRAGRIAAALQKGFAPFGRYGGISTSGAPLLCPAATAR